MSSSDVMLSVTRRVVDSPKCDKCVWWPGSTRTRWGNFSASPDPLAATGERVLLLRGREGRGGRNREREGKEEGKGERKKGGEDREGSGKRDMDGRVRGKGSPLLY